MSTELINVYSISILNGFAPSRYCTLLNWSVRSDVASEQLFARISNSGCSIYVLFKMRNYTKFFIIGIHKFERFDMFTRTSLLYLVVNRENIFSLTFLHVVNS